MPKTLKRKIRVDASLVKRGLASDLKHAEALLLSGVVVVGDQKVDKKGAMIGVEDSIRLKSQSRWVSRAGEKLHATIKHLHFDSLFREKVVLDIGASTGGFSECALACGASKVLALDVGRAQLHWHLATNQKVVDLSGVDIRDFDVESYPKPDIILSDISFNSLERLAPAILRAASGVKKIFIFLVKPQFELPREDVGPGGVVASSSLRDKAVKRVVEVFNRYGLLDPIIFDSPVKGRNGNQETFLIFGVKQDQ